MYLFLLKNFGLKNRTMAAFIYYSVVKRLTRQLGRKPHTLPNAERAKLRGPNLLGQLTDYKFREIAKYLS
jgi:hypothetical protein